MSATILTMIFMIIFFAAPADAYRLFTDETTGGNPKLDKKIYKVYIQSDPTSNNRNEEVKAALNKWKAELGGQGITLELQTGEPPQTPIDFKKFNDEVKKFNDATNPNINDFPEVKKMEDKNCTISVYWDTTANIINRRGGGSERGFTNNFWTLNDKGQADKMTSSDVFLPTDPPGTGEENKKRILHNISLHELGHVSGLDHYTQAQEATGDIMEKDATLHSERLEIGPEEKKGVKTIYDPKPKVKVEGKADNKQSSLLPGFIQDHIPAGMDNVWEYSYDLTWLDGSPASYFQVQTNQVPIFFALGTNGLEDWLFESQPDNSFLEFYANSQYLGEDVFSGTLQMYSSAPPARGWLVYSGDAVIGVSPVPEPATLLLFGSGLLGAWVRPPLKRKDRP